MSIKKTLLGMIAATATALALNGCESYKPGEYLRNSAIPLRNEGLYAKVDSRYARGDAIASADWDNDGDLDLLSSDGIGKVFLYENDGNGNFTKSREPLFEVPSVYRRGCSLDIVDVDKDGDFDVLSSDGRGDVHLYRNMTKERPETQYGYGK